MIGCDQIIKSEKRVLIINKSFQEIKTKAGSRNFSLSCEIMNETGL